MNIFTQYTPHKSADKHYYDDQAAIYDGFNSENSKIINKTIENILKQHNVKSVIDLTCGTGSQVFHLHNAGYDIVGYDISPAMLEVARANAKKNDVNVEFHEGDMRNTQAGQFEAALTIFNSVGHLTKDDFKIAMSNIHKNLKQGGLYIFDIFNVDYITHDDHMTELTMDRIITKDNGEWIRETQFSYVDHENALISMGHTIYKPHKYACPDKMVPVSISLQCYKASELVEMLNECGFDVVQQTGTDGMEFSELYTDRILTVARKR